MNHVRLSLLATLVVGTALGLTGCGAPADDDDVEHTAESAEAITVDPNLSLIATKLNDATALQRFSLKRVMQQIIDRMPGVAAQTPTELFHQMFSGYLNCTSTFNGFALECPRTEANLSFKMTDPFAAGGADSYSPVALVNRFDLAPSNGANCGEYRIIFAKKSSSFADRNFIIFEGRLPNPSAALGLKGCKPVAQMWADLSSNPSATARADQLEAFFFTGLTAGGVTFEPVVDPTHYGMTATFKPGGNTRGQIRVNSFMVGRSFLFHGPPPPPNQTWQLREMQTRKVCDAHGLNCSLQIQLVPAQNNPDASLFVANPAAGSLAETFQTVDFINMIPRLVKPTQAQAGAADAVAFIGMSTATKYDSGESNSDARQDYMSFAAGNTTFFNAIDAKLAQLNRPDLTHTDIINRAMTQSCAGCHEVASTRALGDGIKFPAQQGFVHVDESGTLSKALTTVFLPFRKTVLENFVNAP
jgi:hypothetical protein